MTAAGGASPMPLPFGRIAAFTVVSISLHALMLGASVSAWGPAGEEFAAPPLHAMLAPAPAPDSTAAASRPADPAADTTSQPTADATQKRETSSAGPEIPLPDKWYTAAELDVRAQPLTREKLEYPIELGPLGPAGTVRVNLFIDERGVVRKTQLVEAGAVAAFDRAALEAFRDVRFSPGMKNGAAVKSQKLLELEFRPDAGIR